MQTNKNNFNFSELIETLIQESTTYIANTLAHSNIKSVKNYLINYFLRNYIVNFDDITKTTAEEYTNFNDFFTRDLKPGVRPIDDNAHSIVSCCDGTISEFGSIDGNRLIQAKNKYYTIDNLLADPNLAEKFSDGTFITTYLAPTDYHKVHMPFDGTLLHMKYIPGKLFSVRQDMIAGVDNLFTRNERLICSFTSQFGQFTIALIGAQLVSGLETVWHGKIKRSRKIKQWDYNDKNITLKKGQELGRFNFGSTVILCLQNNTSINDHLNKNQKIKLGTSIMKFLET